MVEARYCEGKSHRRKHRGYGGRRVLVSRKWFGKTLADHRAWVLARLAEAGVPVSNRPTRKRSTSRNVGDLAIRT